jgi:hypothetical protein
MTADMKIQTTTSVMTIQAAIVSHPFQSSKRHQDRPETEAPPGRSSRQLSGVTGLLAIRVSLFAPVKHIILTPGGFEIPFLLGRTKSSPMNLKGFIWGG